MTPPRQTKEPKTLVIAKKWMNTNRAKNVDVNMTKRGWAVETITETLE